MRFRKKSVVIEATQWFKNGDHPLDYENDLENPCPSVGLPDIYSKDYQRANNWEGQVVRYFRRPGMDGMDNCRQCQQPMHDHGWIDTLEGGHTVCPGDWIITGVAGERYPCKPAIFEQTYEPAS